MGSDHKVCEVLLSKIYFGDVQHVRAVEIYEFE